MSTFGKSPLMDLECAPVSNPYSSQQNAKELDYVVLPAAPCPRVLPLPRTALWLSVKRRGRKIRLLSALKHQQADREGTQNASESSLPRGKETLLYLERCWLCSSQQGSTACKGRAMVPLLSGGGVLFGD